MSNMNYFFRNIDKVIYIEEMNKTNIYDWFNSSYKTIKLNRYFYIKLLDTKNTKKLKGFKFLLHSTTVEATNIFIYKNNSKYYINGKKQDKIIFKKKLRKKKIKNLI